MRFIHTADWHLGRSLHGVRLSRSRFCVLVLPSEHTSTLVRHINWASQSHKKQRTNQRRVASKAPESESAIY
jgi:hypothetical protein